MNSTNFTNIESESWFIPLDILLIFSSILVILLAILYLAIIIFDKTCRTIPLMLVANSSLAALIVGCATLAMSFFTLSNDLKQIQYQDSLCVLRAYIGYASYGAMNYSFVIQAFYRYACVVHPNRLFYQSVRFYGLCISSTWLFGLAYCAPFLLNYGITYDVDNQICQVTLQVSFLTIYGSYFGYILPISLIGYLYFKIVQYVKEMGKNVTVANGLIRAQRELKMARRVVILVSILLGICFPYTLIMFMSFFHRAPKYHFRISYIFVDGSVLSVMLSLYQFTDPLKASIRRKLRVQRNTIVSP